MPIITVQRRMAEQGRIRLGHKVTGTNKQGKEYTRPAKLERFRFTSPSQRLIEEIAAKYGGEARPWDNDGKAEWEVLSDATAIPVIVVKGGFSQWHEHFTKGGLQHRCDGEKDAAGNFCDPDDEFHKLAIEKPTTRLSVMLSEIESLGVWRMESKGWNAAAELPSMAELAMHVSDLVPATLGLAERSSVIQTDRGPQTSRYVVPFLDLHVTKQRLVEIVGGPGGAPALESPADAPAAIESPLPDYKGLADVAPDLDTVRAIWHQAADKGHLNDDLKAYLTDRGNALQVAETSTAGGGGTVGPPVPETAPPVVEHAEPDEDGVVDAEVVDNGDADAIWQRILAAGGQQGMGLSEVSDDFSKRMGGLIPDDASAAELQHYLGLLTTGEQVPA